MFKLIKVYGMNIIDQDSGKEYFAVVKIILIKLSHKINYLEGNYL